MNYQQKENVRRMRTEGYSYTKIADLLGISENTIKSFCRRNNIGGVASVVTEPMDGAFCRQCGAQLKQIPGKKHKRFCSDKCRLAWWNDHPEAVNRKATYTFTCPICGREFESYGNKNRKYCSRTCYGRSKAVHHE